MTTCVDLRTLAGKRYRLAHEHLPTVRQSDDPWLLIIPARFGHFYPHSDKLVGFATINRGPTARALAALPYVTVLQDASDGLNLAFPVEWFADVAAIAKPRLRRRLSAAHKAKLLAASKPFLPKIAVAQAPQNEPESTEAA